MGLFNGLGYRMKRFFQAGEEGVVEAIESEIGCDYQKDDFGHLPKIVTIRNPLGERVRLFSSMGLALVNDETGLPEAKRKYKIYIPGEGYP